MCFTSLLEAPAPGEPQRCAANKWMKMIPENQALNEFELIWRFSDAQKYVQLSPDEFNRFHPISAKEGLKLWEKYVYSDRSWVGPRQVIDIAYKIS